MPKKKVKIKPERSPAEIARVRSKQHQLSQLAALLFSRNVRVRSPPKREVKQTEPPPAKETSPKSPDPKDEIPSTSSSPRLVIAPNEYSARYEKHDDSHSEEIDPIEQAMVETYYGEMAQHYPLVRVPPVVPTIVNSPDVESDSPFEKYVVKKGGTPRCTRVNPGSVPHTPKPSTSKCSEADTPQPSTSKYSKSAPCTPKPKGSKAGLSTATPPVKYVPGSYKDSKLSPYLHSLVLSKAYKKPEEFLKETVFDTNYAITVHGYPPLLPSGCYAIASDDEALNAITYMVEKGVQISALLSKTSRGQPRIKQQVKALAYFNAILYQRIDRVMDWFYDCHGNLIRRSPPVSREFSPTSFLLAEETQDKMVQTDDISTLKREDKTTTASSRHNVRKKKTTSTDAEIQTVPRKCSDAATQSEFTLVTPEILPHCMAKQQAALGKHYQPIKRKRSRKIITCITLNCGAENFNDVYNTVTLKVIPEAYDAYTVGVRETSDGKFFAEVEGEYNNVLDFANAIKKVVDPRYEMAITPYTETIEIANISIVVSLYKIESAIRKLLGRRNCQTLIISKPRATSRTTKMVLVTVDCETATILLKKKRISDGWVTGEVMPYIPTYRCLKCHMYGHEIQDCLSDADRIDLCWTCGTPEHESQLCNLTPCCLVCKEDLKVPYNHFPGSLFCKAYRISQIR